MAALLDPSQFRRQAIIEFKPQLDGSLTVSIETERLLMNSIETNTEHFRDLVRLFRNEEADPTDLKKRVRKIVAISVDRWSKGNPYSAFTVQRRVDSKLVGYVALEPGDRPGQAELVYLFSKDSREMEYEREAVTVVVKEYAPETLIQGYTILERPLDTIWAKTKSDDEGSIKFLKELGMNIEEQNKKLPSMKNRYFCKL